MLKTDPIAEATKTSRSNLYPHTVHTYELELDPKTILNKVYEFWTFKYLGKRKRYQQLSDRQRFWYWKLAWD